MNSNVKKGKGSSVLFDRVFRELQIGAKTAEG